MRNTEDFTAGQTRKAELVDIDLRFRHIRRRRHMRQKSAQLLPALPSGRANVRIRKQQSEILLQSAVDGVPQRKRHDSRNELCRHAAGERAHSTCSGDGLARSARTGRRLGLRKGCCCSTNQDSGQQENAAAFVTESQGSLLASNFRGGGAEGEYPSLAGYFWQMGKALPAGSQVRSAIVVRVPLATSVVFGAGCCTKTGKSSPSLCGRTPA
jgi:hypothetical protein